jgi:hypothetical protein
MMAKMFYTLEEAKNALAKSEEEIKQFAREGRLREFRDGPRLMFKADQVEQLKGELGGADTVDLGVSDSGGMIGLVDTTGASGTSITLSEADTGAGGSTMGMRIRDDSGAGDTALGGSLGGVPSPTRPGGSLAGGSLSGGSVAGGSMSGLTGSGISLAGTGTGMGLSSGGTAAGISAGGTGTGMSLGTGTGISLAGTGMGGTGMGMSGTGVGRGAAGGTRSGSGINVFGSDDLDTDPSAQTAISGGAREQMNLEGVGSGSGLLDLTRESDDTSLGAVLDEIGPAGTRTVSAIDTGAGTGTGLAGINESAVDRRPVAAPVFVQQLDPSAPAFGAMALAGFAAMLFAAYVLISALVGTWPDLTQHFRNSSILYPAGIGLGLAVVLFVIGLVAGKAARR